MRTTQIKKKLHDYIDAAEDKKLKAIYTLLEEEIAYHGYLTPDQLKEVDQRLEDHETASAGHIPKPNLTKYWIMQQNKLPYALQY